MYWLLKPTDFIWNYKLPIETKWLSSYWKEKITEILIKQNLDYIIDLLPDSYKKMIDYKKLSNIIKVNFLTTKNWKIQKISHWVKVIKWKFIKQICQNKWIDLSKYDILENNINIFN